MKETTESSMRVSEKGTVRVAISYGKHMVLWLRVEF